MSKKDEKKKCGRRKQYEASRLVRCTKTELENLRSRAKESNLSLSRFLVECGLKAENLPDPKERELRERAVFELRKAGVNLNQITKRVNQNSGTVSGKQIEELIGEINRAVSLIEQGYRSQNGLNKSGKSVTGA